MKNIKLVLIGNSSKQKEIGKFVSEDCDSFSEEANTIFNTYCKSSTKYGQKNKVNGKNGSYYFISFQNSIFYLILAINDNEEREVFEMIEEIENKKLFLTLEENCDRDNYVKEEIKNIIDKYENMFNNKILDANKENSNKIDNQICTDQIVIEDIQELKRKSDSAGDNLKITQDKNMNITKFLKNCKWTILVITLLIAFSLAIILAFSLQGNNDNHSKDDKIKSKNENYTKSSGAPRSDKRPSGPPPSGKRPPSSSGYRPSGPPNGTNNSNNTNLSNFPTNTTRELGDNQIFNSRGHPQNESFGNYSRSDHFKRLYNTYHQI